MSWIDCVVDEDYEIYTEFPYNIRKKSTGRVISESIGSGGYVNCHLNGHLCKKHRIVALQFIPNDNPLTKTEVDHINHIKTDYHIENLRWCTRSENLRNRSSHNNLEYEFVDEISEDAIEITDYGRHHFQFYYYDVEDDAFYYYTGVNYRRLHINFNRSGVAFVHAINTNNQRVNICINKFKRLYDLL